MIKSTAFSFQFVVMALTIGLSAACSDGKVTGVDSSAECRAPMAEAGIDATVALGQPVFLNGSAIIFE